jgi:glutamate--cysteine ligase catalytic subunit
MGLLSQGRPLTWTEIKAALEQIRTYGVDQLIHVYNKCKGRQKDAFIWGDEVFYYNRKFLYLVLSFSRSNSH